MEKDPALQSAEHLNSENKSIDVQPVVEANELLSDEKYLENSRQMGELYVTVIQSLIGQAELDESQLDTTDPTVASRILKMKTSVDAHRERQRLLVELNQLTKEDILRPALSRLSEAQAQEVIQTATYRVEETSPGMYVIYMDWQSMGKITSGQALAIQHPDVVSFIMIREIPDKPEFMANNLRENLPHETHHIAWSFQKWDEIVKYAENDEELRKAFAMYQDEILAKMSSEGGLMGYSHIKVCSDEYRTELAAQSPEKIKLIEETVGKLNDILWDEIEPLLADTDINRHDLIYATMEATNFDELEANLQRMKNIIDQQPRKIRQSENDSSGGWGSINT
jgi:hypothetical protein